MLHAEAAMIAVARRYNIQDPNDYRLKEARDTTLAERRQMREDQALRAVSERERAQMRQTQQTTQQTGRNQEYSNHVRAQLDQLRPRALDAVGLGPNQQGQYDPEHVALFTRKLQAHVEQNDIQHLTPQVCLYAARMVIDHLDRERASAGGQGGAVPPNPQPGNRGFSPGAAGGGQGSRPAQDNGWDGTTAGFEKRYNLKPWQREQ
jgi:hypothetical protein